MKKRTKKAHRLRMSSVEYVECLRCCGLGETDGKDGRTVKCYVCRGSGTVRKGEF